MKLLRIAAFLVLAAVAALGQGQPINLLTVSGTAIATGNGVSGAGVQRVAIVSDNTAFSVNAIQSGNWTARIVGNGGAITDFAGQNAASPANSFQVGGQFNTTPTTLTNGDSSPLQLNNAGALLVTCTSGCSASSTISLIPATTGGLTLSHVVAAASTNATSLKASAGQVYEVCLNSNAAYNMFLKLYNKATAPTVGTDTPVKVIQAQAGLPACMRSEEGFTFGTGIAWALTKGITDADATAVLVSDGTVEIGYK